ncbi:MAG: type II toxin-antitoxin system RelE/ParE family toxin [Spirochaetota bacterium]
MTDIKILSDAQLALMNAVRLYEEKSKGLGMRLLSEIESSLEIIRRFPECCPVRSDDTRRYLINRFPYLIIYTFHKKKIWFLSFSQCRRKPEYWINRMKNEFQAASSL